MWHPFLLQPLIEAAQAFFQISHQAAHHAARQAGADEEAVHEAILGADVVAQKIIDKSLRELAGLHVSLDVDIRQRETSIFEHSMNGEQVGMSGAPAERLHTHINNVCPCTSRFKRGSNRKTGCCVPVVL